MFAAHRVVVAFLKGDSGVTDICNGRIFYGVAKQGTPFPYLIYSSVGEDDINSNSGPGSTTQARVQVTVYSTVSPDEAQNLAIAVCAATGDANVTPKDEEHEAFDGFIGTVAGIGVQRIDGEVLPGDPEPPAHAGDNSIHRVVMQFEIVTVES